MCSICCDGALHNIWHAFKEAIDAVFDERFWVERDRYAINFTTYAIIKDPPVEAPQRFRFMWLCRNIIGAWEPEFVPHFTADPAEETLLQKG